MIDVSTMSDTDRQTVVDAIYEGLNGLTIGWQLANVRDDEQRTRLQAPVIAGQEALTALLKSFEA